MTDHEPPTFPARLRGGQDFVLPLVPLPPPLAEAPGHDLAALLPVFLGWLTAHRSAATVEQYGRDLRQFVAFAHAAGLRDPRRLDHRAIEAYSAWLQDRGLTANSAAQHHYAIRRWCWWMARERIIPTDPAHVAIGPKTTRALPRGYLSPEEQECVLTTLAQEDTLQGRRDYAVIAFALLLGARCAEIADQRLEDLHLDAGRVAIFGKGSKWRELPVVARLAVILREYLDTVRPACLARSREPSPFLFVRGRSHGPRGALPLERRTVYRLIRERVTPIVGRRVSPHQLRHSFATRLTDQGAPIQFTQQMLGHEDIRTTTVYSHLVTTAHRAQLDAYLRPPSLPATPGETTGGLIPGGPAPTPPPLEAARPAGPHAAVGARVTALRRRLGLTLDGLARKLGTSRPSVARIERGDALPRAALLSRLATLSGRPAEWILSGPPRGDLVSSGTVGSDEPLPPALTRRLPKQRQDAVLGPYVALGGRLLDLRRRVGLTQGVLADRAGVARQTVARLERGAGIPNAPQLARMAKALGVPLDTLLRAEDGASPTEPAPDRTDPRCCARCGQEKPETVPGPRLPRHRRYDLRTGPFIAVGSRIVMARHRHRWSRDELARRARLGRMTLARLEAGTVCPRSLTLQRLAEACGVTTDWILTGRTEDEGRT